MQSHDSYQQVAEEIKAGQIDEAIWVRSVAESNGDDAKARSLYLKFRAEKVENILRHAAAVAHRAAVVAAQAEKEEARSRDGSWERSERRKAEWAYVFQWLGMAVVIFPLIFFLLVGLGYCTHPNH